MKKIYSLLLLVVTTFSFGQVFTDDFNYPDSALLTANGWTAHSAAGTNAIDVGASNGLNYAGYTTTAGNAALVDNTGEDVNKLFTGGPITSGTLYFSFLVNVSAAVEGYFTHLGPGGAVTSPYAARVFVKPSANAGKINFGLSNSGTAAYAATPTDFDLNTTYLIIVKYDVSASGAASIWIKSSGVPATEAAAGAPEYSTTGGGTASVNAYYLRQYNAGLIMTLDEVKIYTTWFGAAPCSLSLGTESATCDNITLNVDTYTVNIPFTGGASGTYNLSVNAGTLGGASPTTNATGDIIISGVPEGTSVTLTVSGTCGFTKTVASPECKPINTLPYQESFPYTVGASLNAEQKWSLVNTGDNITIASGSLAYPGITASGNSITFVGTGGESRTLFTSTNTGYVYSSFIVNISDLANVTTDLANTYFALFTDATGSTTNARVWIRKNGTQYQYGLGTGSSPTDWDSTLYDVNSVQYVVLSYDFTGNTLSLFINPTIGGSAAPTLAVTPTSPYSNLGGFMFRQDLSNTTPTVIVDELRIDVTPNFTLGVKNNNITGLRVYPNPVSNGTLFIETAANAEKTVTVFDVLGKQVLNTTTSDNTVNVSALHTGVYIVNITEEGKTASRKLVIR
ncbi:T9SS type A sorting domain-containing protein [Flavobacterium sp. AS60]|uniref:T9SS type A sorting domain-containing protein n=1 Tax=Flavobacterium anseongense TaxID=2910677 RepID=UPI001F351779|nr:T9SS type A sorting domain-containing protein [Flavobacterium sp. AS60]MCF6129251.1 T9SS type A sorting domain-containing protein [Flavobacterium sp. AS60]